MPLNRIGLLLLALLITAPASRGSAEHPSERWEQDIQTFESLESELAPMPGCILFTGSSSIRMWDLDTHLPSLHAVNRGFGGSQMLERLYYTDRLVIRHEPLGIVVYSRRLRPRPQACPDLRRFAWESRRLQDAGWPATGGPRLLPRWSCWRWPQRLLRRSRLLPSR